MYHLHRTHTHTRTVLQSSLIKYFHYLITIFIIFLYLLHSALASGAVYCNRPCLYVCVIVAGGRAVSEPYYSLRARSVGVSLSAFSLVLVFKYSLQRFIGI